MNLVDTVLVRRFEDRDQDAARRLILEGLGGHFGFIDETMNPDLDDIATSYADGLFLVAECDGQIVGTGVIVRDGTGSAVVRRMSTSAAHRRRGVAWALLDRLVEHARETSCGRVVLTTNDDWQDAIAFYLAFGFRDALHHGGGVVFVMDL